MNVPTETTIEPMATDYNDLSAMQAEWASRSMLSLKEALQLCVTDQKGPFTILELGCATGGNSVVLLKLVCSFVPSERSVLVVQNDLPDNAWNECFALVPQWSDGRCSHAVIGASFYSPLLPPSSVDFVFSSTALHWGRFVVAFPFCESDMSDYYSTLVQESEESMRLLVRNTLASLKPGGTVHWKFYGLTGDIEKDTLTQRVNFAHAALWAELLQLSEEEKREFWHAPLIMRTPEHVRNVLHEFDDIEIIEVSAEYAKTVSLPPDLAGPVIAKGIVAATFRFFLDRAKSMFPTRQLPDRSFFVEKLGHICSNLGKQHVLMSSNLIVIWKKKQASREKFIDLN
jgi:hypothetical protein